MFELVSLQAFKIFKYRSGVILGDQNEKWTKSYDIEEKPPVCRDCNHGDGTECVCQCDGISSKPAALRATGDIR
jgi:hypothetical protein